MDNLRIKLVKIFVWGIISGMPFTIMVTCISMYLTEGGIDLAVITTFSIAKLPYSLKVIWAPFVDYWKAPLLHRFCGKRRGWMVITTIAIALLLLLLSKTNPEQDIVYLRILTIALGFFSATYDIVYDGLRIEMVDEKYQAKAAFISNLGYRIGLLVSGAGALYFTSLVGGDWGRTFRVLAYIFCAGSVVIFILSDGVAHKVEQEIPNIYRAVIEPIKELLKIDGVLILIIGIASYKIGKAMISTIGMPFYNKLGFSRNEISSIVKIIGFISTTLGTYVGALIFERVGRFRAMVRCGLMQLMVIPMMIWLHHQGHNIYALGLTMFVEDFTAGMASTALISYISLLCSKKYSTTHFAILSGVATLANNTINIFSGSIVKSIGWDLFFILAMIISIPSLFIISYLYKRDKMRDIGV